MKVIRSILIALAIMVPLLVVIPTVASPAEAAKSDIYCRIRRSHAKPVRFTFIPLTAGARFYYNQCWHRSTPKSWWVVLKYIRYRTTRPAATKHGHEYCPPLNPVDPYYGATFQAYVWNTQTGANWNGKPHKLNCDSDGSVTLTMKFNRRVVFHNTNGVWPKWKVNVQERLGLGIPDRYGIVHGYLR